MFIPYSTVYFLLILLFALSWHVHSVDPDRELVHDGTIFGIFTGSTNAFNRETGVRDCIIWGGNLATIRSLEEDQEVFKLTNSTHYQCWIGLEKNALNPGAEGYSWVDGSNSSYRKFSSSASPYNRNFMKFRPNNGHLLTEGWMDDNLNDNTNCYLCGKLASSRGCGFTGSGFCYRTYQMDTTINWYDAQSNCVDWGGNLASIHSEAENELTFRRRPFTGINCWIGMYTTVTGNTVWNDGTALSFTNWLPGQTISPPSCVEWNDNGGRGWLNTNCNTGLKCYICKRAETTVFDTSLQREFRYGDLIVAYFTTSQIGILQTTALQECFGWGGSLVTITLSVVDQLLYNTAMVNDVECWIGLEISTRGNKNIIWVDGSDSTYRNYPGMTPNNNAIAKYYALRNRNGAIGDGWDSRNPQETLSCYFCGKLANSRGCQLINDGYCYRTFETNNLVNWDTAQAKCVYWGGNLASITSQTENDYLYERTPYTATDCWIGMYKFRNGGYSWNDGEALSYTNWVPMDQNTGSCVVYKVGGNNAWHSSTCSTERMCYTCKRDEPPNYNPNLGELFGELINGNIGYKELALNAILYRNVTLICGNVINLNSSSIDWIHSANNDQSVNSTVSANSFNSQSGITYISATLSQQGFYQCRIQKQNGDTSVYTVGVFDLLTTTVAESGRTYNYTIGIDRENIQLLCTSMNTSIDPINYRWRFETVVIKDNPLLLSNFASSILNFICDVFNTEIFTITTIVRAPILTITNQGSSMQTYTQVYPNTTQLSIQGLKQDFTLSSNIEGRWRLPDGSYQAGSTLSYPYLIQQYTGLYTFYLYNLDGMEVPAMLVQISVQDVTGIFLRETTSLFNYLPDGYRLFITESITSVLCVGPNTSSIVEWYSHSELNSNKTLLTAGTGVNSYNININDILISTYFTCEVEENDTYAILVARMDIIVQVFNFDETFSFTLGSPSLLYYFNASIPDSLIRWTTETVLEGDVQTLNLEYTNPVPLSTVFSDVGGGQHTITCFYRNSPAMVLGNVPLFLKDNATVILTYNGNDARFNDSTNPYFPAPNKFEIKIPTNSPIIFNCSLQKCVWKIQFNSSKNNSFIHNESFIINVLTEENEGTYSLYKQTEIGVNYTTASVYIKIIPSPIGSETSMNFIIFAGIGIVGFVIIVAIVVGIIILISYIVKRKSNNQFRQKKLDSASDTQSKSNNQHGAYYEINMLTPKDTGIYMCLDDDEIDETTFTPSKETSNYQNVGKFNFEGIIYEKIPNDPRMIPMPLDTYKTHVDKLWKEEGSLEQEYESFGGKSQRYPWSIAMQDSNKSKNRFKFIYPYDKSRVVLQRTGEDPSSDYINASHIPGFYVKNNFICSQAPKDSTLQSFWQMIIENNVVNIVMVTNLVEMGKRKCTAYLPLKKIRPLTIGPYEVVLVQENVRTGYTIRKLKVSHFGKVTQIEHFHFTAWPDHDVPTLYDELLSFVEKVEEGLIESEAPLLVHCSAGVGRSGTFLSLFNLSTAIRNRKAISIYNLVHEMREHRPQMVQTLAQYKFIYLSVLEILLGNTSVPSGEFTNTYRLYMQSENEGYISVFFQQYSELNYQCDKAFSHICTIAENDANTSKNPIKTTLPQDTNRVILFSPHLEGDYINATSFDDVSCIVTINPTKNTLQDFFQLIYQVEPSLVVMLTTPKELRLIKEGNSDRVVYWPNQGEPFNTNGFELTSSLSEKSSSFLRNKIIMHHTAEQIDRNFEQFISSKWNEKEEPDLESVVMLLQAMLIHKEEYPTSPIIIHCTDGAGKSGVLFTVFRAILDSREKNFIDLFHIVKKLRSERMNFVPTLTNFVSCFTLMNEYCSNAL